MLAALFYLFSKLLYRTKMITNSHRRSEIASGQRLPVAYWQNAKYQTCCCHVKTVATILGVMSIVSSCVLITYSIYNLIEPNRSAGGGYENFRTDLSSAMSVIFSLLSLIFVCLMFYGLNREYALLLMAHLVVLALTITCWTGIFTVKTVYVIRHSELLKGTGLIGVWIITLMIFFAYLLLQIYYFYVSYKCYLYIKEKRTFVAAVEIYQHQWARHSSLEGVVGPQRSHRLNITESFAPAYYTVVNSQQVPSIFQTAPPLYGSWQRPSVQVPVPPSSAPQAWVTASPPPTYTMARTLPNFEVAKPFWLLLCFVTPITFAKFYIYQIKMSWQIFIEHRKSLCKFLRKTELEVSFMHSIKPQSSTQIIVY